MTIFLPFYVAALALLVLELRGVRIGRVWPVPRGPALVWIFLLLAAYAVHLAIVWYAATAVNTPIAWPAVAPIGVASADVRHPNLVSAALLAIGALESFALLGLYRAKPFPVLAALGAAVLIAASLAAPAFESPDAYAYVGDALLGAHAYSPPNDNFAGEFVTINRFFPSPMLPAPYGPLWLAVATIATAPFGGLFGKLLALRLLGAAAFAALLAGLRAFGVGPRALAVLALNPALAAQYVCDAHNDLLALALVVAAAAAIRRTSVVAGTGLAAAAGLVKLPFVVVALPVFASVRSRAARYACAAAAAGIASLLSWWTGGAAYAHGLAVHVPLSRGALALNLAVALTALLLLLLALAGARRWRAGVWPIAMMSSYVATWYLPYGIAYALARRRILAYLAIALPLACALVDAKFARWWTVAIVLPLVVAACAFPARGACAANGVRAA